MEARGFFLDDGRGVDTYDSAGTEIEAASDALAVISAGKHPAPVGYVIGDRAAGDAEGTDAHHRAAVVVDAAPQPVAASPPLAAHGPVASQRAVTDDEVAPEVRRQAPLGHLARDAILACAIGWS